MDKATPNLSVPSVQPHRQMDFVSKKTVKKVTDQPDRPAPTPVTSAKAAINAMYAARAGQPTPVTMAPSAREAVNATARQGAGRNAKSASNLHHGSIQKDIDTSRTSAAALLIRAKSPQPSPTDTTAADSYDPLASRVSLRPKPAVSPKPAKDTPVIYTSLKLGSSAHPQPTPVVLPPGARMARQARPVGNPAQRAALLARLPEEVQIIQPNSVNAGQAPKRIAKSAQQLLSSSNEGALEVQILSSHKGLVKAPSQMVKSAPSMPRSSGPVRDPQMLGARRPGRPGATPLWPAAAATALSPKPKFRSAPRGYASVSPTGISADNSYVMSTPPKLNLTHHAPGIKADNTSNYSFSQPKDQPNPSTKPDKSLQIAKQSRYSSTESSPFIKSVNVEKRPLSHNSSSDQFRISRHATAEKPHKAARKNIYARKKSKFEMRQELPQRPTVIVPASRRSKIPLFFLILFTIILGAVVGAATYLCFFQ